MRAVFCPHFSIYFWRCLNIATKELQINEEIRDKEVRVITDDGEQLGVMSASEALKRANERNLDLVKIAPQAVPPVCKIMNYGKYKFDQQKREKEAKKNQNQYVNTDGVVTQSLFMIDTHSYLHKGVIGGLIDFVMWNYDNIKQDQVDWYENMIKLYNPQSSLMFMHIPLEEVKMGYDEYVANGREVGGNVSWFSGNDGEKNDVVYPSDKGDNLFEKILELNNTKYVFFGHDHFNNFVMQYKGVVFSYGHTIDYIAYGKKMEKMGYQRGCTVIELDGEMPGLITITHENYYQEKYQSLDEMQTVDMSPDAYK